MIGRKCVNMIKQLWKEIVMLTGERESNISTCPGGWGKIDIDCYVYINKMQDGKFIYGLFHSLLASSY